MAARQLRMLDARSLRALQDELLRWSLRPPSSRHARCLRNGGCADWEKPIDYSHPFISVLYPERTIAFIVANCQKRLGRMVQSRRRHFSQTHGAFSRSDKKDKPELPLHIPQQISDMKYWEQADQTSPQPTTKNPEELTSASVSPEAESLPDCYLEIPTDPDKQFVNLMKISASYNVKLSHVAFQLWTLCCTSDTTRVQVMAQRFQVFSFFRESLRKIDWQRLVLMVNDVPKHQLTEIDLRYRLWALIQLESSEAVDQSFLECARLFPTEMETQWQLLEQYHSKRREFDQLFVSWCAMTQLSDPTLAKTPVKKIREMFLKCVHHADTIGQIVSRDHKFGNRIARIAISILGELGAPSVAHQVYLRMFNSHSPHKDLQQIVRLLNRSDMAKEASELLAGFSEKFPDHVLDREFTGSKLATLAALEQYQEMQNYFERLVAEGVSSDFHYNVAMHALGTIGQVHIVNQLLEDMVYQKMKISPRVIATVMWSRLRVGDIDGTVYLYNNLNKYGVTATESIMNILMNAYAKRSDIDSMFNIFKFMVRDGMTPGKHHITTLMNVFAQRGAVKESETIFKYLRNLSIQPDAAVFNTLALAYVRDRSQSMDKVAFSILTRMREADVVPSTKVFATLMSGFAREEDATGIRRMIELMNELSVPMNPTTYAIMITYLGVIEQVSAAEKVLDQLPSLGVKQSAYHYTPLITTYSRMNDRKAANAKYSDMTANKISPTFLSMERLLEANRMSPKKDETWVSTKLRQQAPRKMFNHLLKLAAEFPSLDLTLKDGQPKTTVPAYMFTEILRFMRLKRAGDSLLYAEIAQAYEAINNTRDFHEQIQPDFQLDGEIVIAAASQQDWDIVKKHWNRFNEAWKASFRVFNVDTGQYEERLEGFDQGFVDAVVAAWFDFEISQQHYSEVETMWHELESYGVRFGNLAWNARVRALLNENFYTALQVMENVLNPGTKTISKLRLDKIRMDPVRFKQRYPEDPVVPLFITTKTFRVLHSMLVALRKETRAEIWRNKKQPTRFQLIVENHKDLVTSWFWFKRQERLNRVLSEMTRQLKAGEISFRYYMTYRKRLAIESQRQKLQASGYRQRVEFGKKVLENDAVDFNPWRKRRLAIIAASSQKWFLHRLNKIINGERRKFENHERG